MKNFNSSKGSLLLKMALGLFLVSNILGCASMAVNDSVPKGMPKGCVRFYYDTKEDIGGQIQVYRIKNNERIYEGRTSNWALGKETGFILSKSPGEYDFLLTIGTGEGNVHVRVEEGMMTPVRISLKTRTKSIKHTDQYITTTTHFRMPLTVEPMQPMKKK